jgi:transcriptional regulator of acetoin/glycerol metabolism
MAARSGSTGILDERRQAARVRDLYLDRTTDDLTGVRPIVARSWRRSRAAGVDAVADRAIHASGRVDEPTMLAATPHLLRLDEVASDLGGYVSLTAPNGALIRPSFLREEDCFPAGYSLLEESCGSNGEGLALEEGRGVWLAPEEHFREDMRANWCFASLIRDPFHSRVRAVIGLTLPVSRVRDVDPASTLLMLEGVSSRIERELESRTSSKERALLHEYLTVSRRRSGAAVIGVDGKNSLMNGHATRLLEDDDFSVIMGYAKEVMSSGSELTREVTLKGVGAATLECSPVAKSESNAGAIIVVKPRAKSRVAPEGPRAVPDERVPDAETSDHFHGLQGTSTAFRRSVSLARTALDEARSVILIGEPGSGKRRLADAIAAGRGDFLHTEAMGASPRDPRVHDVLRELDETTPTALVIEGADELSQLDATEIADHLRHSSRTTLILTCTRMTWATQMLAETCDALEIPVAPLRARREDISLLTEAIASELGDRKLSRNLVATLTNADWQRNIDQLRSVVSHAMTHAQGPEVTVDDLPHGFQAATTHGRLSRLEDAELSELRQAIREADGNRRLAAEMLEIGRSTLYRRMDYFRSRGFDI